MTQNNEPTHYVSDQIAEGPRKFRHKPTAVEAFQVTRNNWRKLKKFWPELNPRMDMRWIRIFTPYDYQLLEDWDYVVRDSSGKFSKMTRLNPQIFTVGPAKEGA